jgi:myxalamid-type polyketide synthase MxaE and MxaD
VALASLRRKCSLREVMLASLGRLYALGYSVEWDRLYKPAGRSVPLPAYPWQRERFWPVDARGPAGKSPMRSDTHPLLGERLPEDATSETHCWQTELSRSSCPFLNDHRVQGAMVLPAAAYVEMALAASAEALGAGPHTLEQIHFLKALFLPEDGSRTVRLAISTAIPGAVTFEILSRQGSQWVLHANGAIGRGGAGSHLDSAGQIRSRCLELINGTEHYQRMQKQGLNYGPSFQGVQQIWRRDGEALGRLQLRHAVACRSSAHHAHLALLDAGFQLLAAAVPKAEANFMDGNIYVPVNLGSARNHLRPDPGAELWGYALVRSSPESGTDAFEGDVFLMDAGGKIAVEALGLRMQRLERAGRPGESDGWSDWLYEVQWQPKQLTHPKPTSHPAGRWLILADSRGVGKTIGTQLEARGESCVTMVRDELGAARPEEFQRLLHQAFGDAPPQGVIHIWSLDAPPPEALTLASLHAAQEAGCGTLLHLVQALAQMPWRPAPRLWLVTRAAKAVRRSSTIHLAQWPLSGLARVIALEHPELRCSEVDLSWESSTEEMAALIEEFLANDIEAQVALHGGMRYLARIARAPLKPAAEVEGLVPAQEQSKHNVFSLQDKSVALTAPVAGARFSLREEATYLITGGLGGLGLQVARWMVERGARHLVLIGRAGASESSRGAIRSLEQAGAQVVVVRADVTSTGQVATLLAQIDRDLPPLRGIIHAAGILDDGVLLQQNWQRFANVMAPKVTGAWNLHTLTLGRPLDFFVLFSSMGAVVGSPGQGNYASANAFLDGLAHYRRAQGLPALSINWGPWAEVGMAAATNQRVRRTGLRGIGAIAPQAGLQALEQLLRQPSAQIAVININWREFQVGAAAPSLLADLIAQEAPALPAAALEERRFGDAWRTAQPEEQETLLETYLREQLGRVLGSPLSALDIHQPLSNAGFDSLMAVELTAKIQNDLRVKVPITHILQGPSLRQMTTYLLEQLRTQWLLEPLRANPAKSGAEEWEVLTL